MHFFDKNQQWREWLTEKRLFVKIVNHILFTEWYHVRKRNLTANCTSHDENWDKVQLFKYRLFPVLQPASRVPVLSFAHYFRAPATQATSSSDRDPSLKRAFALTMNNELPFLLREIKVMHFLTCRMRRKSSDQKQFKFTFCSVLDYDFFSKLTRTLGHPQLFLISKSV